ncbi:MAG: hypothetical protein QOE48_2867 [Mycobacterium sp.]|nr:hypothetical protein [Mycobacterium sp.]MDT5307189.1 hypothetical protein [Mycobacterium sp.]
MAVLPETVNKPRGRGRRKSRRDAVSDLADRGRLAQRARGSDTCGSQMATRRRTLWSPMNSQSTSWRAQRTLMQCSATEELDVAEILRGAASSAPKCWAASSGR